MDRTAQYVECGSQGALRSHRCDWKPIKIMQEVFEKHSGAKLQTNFILERIFTLRNVLSSDLFDFYALFMKLLCYKP